MTRHTITLRPSGNQFQCDDGETILKAGLAAGLLMPYSCRSGACNTCRGTVKQGKVDFGNVHPTYLSDDDKRAGKALLCSAKAIGDCSIEVRELDPGEAFPVRRLPCRVLHLERVAPDVMLVTIGLPPNEPAVFKAGQYVDFLLKDGTRRSYSIATAPVSEGVRQFDLHVRLVPGGRFTEHVFSTMRLRETMMLEMPLGSFYWRARSDKPMIMLASGTGFAPIKSIIDYSIVCGNTRPITLYWGGRTRACLYMAALVEKWVAEHDHIKFIPVVSDATPGCNWTGRSGFVHEAAMEDFPDMSACQVYACGAPVVVDSARRDFTVRCGLPEGEFYADSFINEADRQKAAA